MVISSSDRYFLGNALSRLECWSFSDIGVCAKGEMGDTSKQMKIIVTTE